MAAEKIVIEAEDARGMNAPFVIRRDERASGGMSVGIPDKTETGRDAKPPEVVGSVRYSLTLEKDGKYAFWVRKWWMDGCGNSVKLSVDDLPAYQVGEDGTYLYWDWIKMPIDLELKAGEHTMDIHNNEDGVWLDQIVVTDDLQYVPAGQEAPGDTTIKERDIYLADDFMRAENQTGAWTAVSGSWKVSALDHPERSANAFQYAASGDGARLVTTGYPFWRDYAIEVAAMAGKGTDLGLVFLRSDESNYYLWSVPVGPGRGMKLSKMVAGKEEVLFRAEKHLRTGQWYKLGAAAYRGNILLEIDDDPVARVQDLSHLKGTVGLYSAGTGTASFDDAFIKSVKLITDDFTDTRLSGWEVTDDAFRVYTPAEKAVALAVIRKGFGRDLTLPSGDGPMLLSTGKGTATTGTAYWYDYTLSFDVLPHLPRAWSVVVGRTEKSEGTVFTFTPTDTGVSVAATDMDSAVEIECGWAVAWHKVRIDNRRDTLSLVLDDTVVMEGGWPETAGRAGFSADGAGVLFDNLAVRTYGRPTPEAKITTQFTLERTMMNWASVQYEWEPDPTGKMVWNRLDFLGDLELSYRYGAGMSADETIRLGISPEKGKADTGVRMIVSSRKVELYAGKESVSADLPGAKAESEPKLDVVSLRRAGDSIVASINGRDILRKQTAGTDGGGRLWVALAEAKVSPEKIRVHTNSTRDYVMGKAPVEWRVSNGHFTVTNRWKCDPRWSWFCVMSPAESIMWNKRSYAGDLSVDMWTGMKMELRRKPTYGDPGDMNLTICADGRSLGTGYSFIYGGYDNTASRLLRNDKVVAETTKVTVPSTRHNGGNIHRRWFHLAMKKRGPRVECWLDEKMVLEYEDPDPLTGTRVAAWTFDNGMMMSRIRISAQDAGPQEPPLVAEAPSAAPSAVEPSPPDAPSDSFRAFDFERGPDGWAPREKVDHFSFDWDPEAWDIVEDNAREVSVRTVPREDGGACLEAENLAGGGTFAVEVPLAGADLIEFPVLGFDCAIPPGVFINLYMKAGTEFYSLALTGHADPIYGVTPLGGVGAAADGKWHTVSVNLRDRFLELQPQAKSVVLDDVFLGNMDNRRYLVCGIGGNLAGSVYRLDNVKLTKTGADEAPPKVMGVIPWDGGPLKVQLDETGGSGVDPASIAARCGDRMYSLDHPALDYSPLQSVLSIDPVLAGMTLKDGAEAEVYLVKLKDFAGNGIPEPIRCAWKTNRKDDTRPPANLQLISPLAHPANNDFEVDLGQWESLESKYPPVLERWREGPANGRWCLRVLSPRVGGSFQCRAVSTKFDAGRFPIVSFYYRLTQDVDVDLSCIVNGARRYIKFADENSALTYIGQVPNVTQDGAWHKASFDLGAMLVKNDPYAIRYVVKSLEFGDWGWTGNARGAELFIDDFRIEPVCGAAGAAKKWRWSAQDPFGISQVLCRLGEEKWTPVPKAAREWLPPKMRPGPNTISIKVSDPAGNWSAPAAETVVFDPTPPVLGKVTPAEGTYTASGIITVAITDKVSGIDKPSIAMTVNGKRCGIADPRLSYDSAAGALVFRRWGGAEDPVFQDGAPVSVAITVQDNGDNRTEKKFVWNMDFSQDKEAPEAPYVAPVLEGALFKENFEVTDNKWRKKFSCSGARFEVLPDSAATGRKCLTVLNTYEGRFRLEPLPPKRVNTKVNRFVVFDYRTDKNARFNLFVRGTKGTYDVHLTEPKTTRRVGRIGAVKLTADDRWHRAVIDLHALMDKSGARTDAQSRDGYVLSRVYIGNELGTNPRNAKIHLDNICLDQTPKSGKEYALEWTELTDATGIVAYSYCLDNSPKTEPTEEMENAFSKRVSITGGGKWFFHVRGRDGAGNWGRTAHYPVRPLAF